MVAGYHINTTTDCCLCLNIVWTSDTALTSDPIIGHDRSISIVCLPDHNTSLWRLERLERALLCIKNAKLKPRHASQYVWCKSSGAEEDSWTRQASDHLMLIVWCWVKRVHYWVHQPPQHWVLRVEIWWSSDRKIWTSCHLEYFNIELPIRNHDTALLPLSHSCCPAIVFISF